MRIGRRTRWALGSVVGLLAVTALAHTPVGLRAIAYVSGSEGCPFGHDQKQPITTAAIEQRRVDSVVRSRLTWRDNAGESLGAATLAPARPALGFTLDTQKRADVLAWTQQHGLTCTENRASSGLRCDQVDGAMLPQPIAARPIDDLRGVVSFGFDTADHLVSVSFQSASTTPKARVLEVAAKAMASLEPLGARSLGDELDAASFIRRETRALYSDYSATVVASNAGKRWMMMQTFQSMPRPSVASR